VIFFVEHVDLEVTDRGRGFAPTVASLPHPDSEGGRGLWLIERLAQSVTWKTVPGEGCHLTARFPRRPARDSRPLPRSSLCTGSRQQQLTARSRSQSTVEALR
jgi:hypothetical protein